MILAESEMALLFYRMAIFDVRLFIVQIKTLDSQDEQA